MRLNPNARPWVPQNPRRESLPNEPDPGTPVGIPEIASLLGYKRQTVDVWRSNRRLPEPDWMVGGSPAWAWRTIREWAIKTGRLGRREAASAETPT